MTSKTENTPKRFMRINEQAEWLGVHPRTIVRIAASDPSFPPEIHLTEGLRVRKFTALEAWANAKEAAAQTPPPASTVTPITAGKRPRGRPRKYPLAS
jgi:predicted DNA-binding transcriptional regulator AlpA